MTKVEISGDARGVIDNLINQYQSLFGNIAVETCRDVTKQLISQLPTEDQPNKLRQ
jgi:hypothetical protein